MNCKLLVVTILSVLYASMRAGAQAVPDTSLNKVVPDTVAARNAPVLSSPAPDQVAYDSLKGKLQRFQPNPKKSALYSAILPGAGQLYNEQYWKIPVIYAGIGIASYFLVDNTKNYRKYRKAYISRINKDPTFNEDASTLIYSPTQLQTLQNAYKKYLDLTVLFTALGYTIQVLDALTFAHLKNFDVSKDISMRMQPVAMPNGDPGLGLVMRF